MIKKLFKFLASMQGRAIRVLLGMLILSFGFEVNPVWLVVGVIPLLAGVFDVCVLAPVFGLPYSGSQLRKLKI